MLPSPIITSTTMNSIDYCDSINQNKYDQSLQLYQPLFNYTHRWNMSTIINFID